MRPGTAAALLLALIAIVMIANFMFQDQHSRQFEGARNLPVISTAWPDAPTAQDIFETALKDIGAVPTGVDMNKNTARIQLAEPIDLSPDELRFLQTRAAWAEWPEAQTTATLTIGITRQHFWLGTDQLGQDRFAQLLKATQTSILFALSATGLAFVIGISYGVISGFLGGFTGQLMMRLLDVFYAIPAFFWAILATLYFGNSFLVLAIIVAAVEWPDIARFVRARSITLKNEDYVHAANALGVSKSGVLRRHILPGILIAVSPIVTISLTRVVALESTVSFLGLGFHPPDRSLGSLIADVTPLMQSQPLLLVSSMMVFISLIWLANAAGTRTSRHIWGRPQE